MHEVTTLERAERVTANVSVAVEEGLFGGLPEHFRQVARGLQTWIEDTRNVTTRGGGVSLFSREKYVASDNIYDQMETARRALYDDDIVAGIAELTEGLAFQGIAWEHSDWDTQDLFNQMAKEQNLDAVVRKIWREEYAVSNVTLAFWWDRGEFTVRGETDKGNKRKTTKSIYFPRLITVLDPVRIVPVGLLAFGQERLCWKATGLEMAAFEQYLYGQYEDDLMGRFYVDQYQVTDQAEQLALTSANMRVDTRRLILLDNQTVVRHTSTRADFERFAPVRLRSIFRDLDLKQQLLEADRVSLVGAANYILLVKKGDKDYPAHPEEIANLRASYQTLAQIPVIFSDHRLSVEIVSPKQDFTLQREKYDVLNTKIAVRMLNGIASSGRGRSGDAEVLMGRPVARSMENRRHMIRRFLERQIAKAVVEHPANEGVFTKGEPSLSFSPPNILIETDAMFAQSIINLRTQRELSRESTLEYFGFDQEVEAMRRELEEVKYDDIFKTQVPFSAAGGAPPADQAGAGGQGGRPTGGGNRSQNPTKTAVTDKGTTTPSKSGS